MSNKKPYYGAARFVEIMPPGIPFRSIANVDHITSIMFGEKREDISTPDPDSGTAMVEEDVLTGFNVNVGVGGVANEFTFTDLKVAMMFYNNLVDRIDSLVPCNLFPPMQPPPELDAEDDLTFGTLDEDAPMSDAELDALSDDPITETEH